MDRIPYLITFGTYGSWLHGDKRGSWEPRHSELGDGFIRRDDFRRGFEQRELRQSPFSISPEARKVIGTAIREVCEKRGWLLLALNVRMQHVHVVVAADASPEAAMQAFKSYSTRRMRESGLVDANARVWARHGSTRYLFEDGGVEAAVEYVLHRQGAALPGS